MTVLIINKVKALHLDKFFFHFQLLEWLKNIMNNSTISNKQVACSFISLVFNTQIKFKTSINFFEAVALRLSEVMGTINEVSFNILHEQNKLRSLF